MKGIPISSWPLCVSLVMSKLPSFSHGFVFFSCCLVYLSMSRWSTTSFIKLSLTTLDITNLSTLYILLPIQASLNQVPNIHLVFQIPKLTVKWFQAYSFDFISWMAGILKTLTTLSLPFTDSIYLIQKILSG